MYSVLTVGPVILSIMLYTGRLSGHQQQSMASTESQPAQLESHGPVQVCLVMCFTEINMFTIILLFLPQPSPPHSVQHIYPKPGTPEAVRKAPGIGGDLAAIIAAKAASRKPIMTSPTHKQSGEDDHFTRSMTVGGEPAIQQAR